MAAMPRRSSILGIAVEVYVRHRLDENGWCGFCQRTGCRAAEHSTRYFQAVGVDPAGYDRLTADDLDRASGELPELTAAGADSGGSRVP